MSDRRLGDFDLLEEIGRGNMGVVYAARQVSVDRRVAVKVLAPALAASEEFVQRFEREARATARLSHPGIVKTYDVGHEGGTHYFAMQLVSGRSLDELLLDHVRLEPRWVASLGIQVARVLAYAHGEGIVHRDIKPGNLMIDDAGRCLVTDFGISLAEAESRLTRTGQRLGSPYYVAPEIVRGEAVDGRSDLYSLGIVLFQALTGQLPYGSGSVFDVFERLIEGPLAHVRDQIATVPDALDRIVARLMARSPIDRYQSGEEAAEDLLQLTGGEMVALSSPAAAPPASTPSAAAPGPRRRRRPTLAVLAAVVIALALFLATRSSCG